MPRKKQVVQRRRRQKVYREGELSASDLKPRGAFKVFSNYKLFAIIGAIVMVGGLGFTALISNTRASKPSPRGSGVIRSTPEAGSTSTTGASSQIKQYDAAPASTIDPTKTYTAVIKTEAGDIRVQLLPQQAPMTVNNFVFLAQDGFYNGVTFHRVIADDSGKVHFAQAGDPTGTGTGGPGYTLPVEAAAQSNFDQPGILAMAKPPEAGAENNGSQFFITLDAEPTFDGKFTAFGKVIDGLDVLEKFQPRDPQVQQDPDPGARITGIEIQVS